jgi:hypothetical protein
MPFSHTVTSFTVVDTASSVISKNLLCARNMHYLHRPVAKLACSKDKYYCTVATTSRVYHAYWLVWWIKKAQIEVALRRCLNTCSFSCVAEYLVFENDPLCCFLYIMDLEQHLNTSCDVLNNILYCMSSVHFVLFTTCSTSCSCFDNI